jgi:hypothetical protein
MLEIGKTYVGSGSDLVSTVFRVIAVTGNWVMAEVLGGGVLGLNRYARPRETMLNINQFTEIKEYDVKYHGHLE